MEKSLKEIAKETRENIKNGGNELFLYWGNALIDFKRNDNCLVISEYWDECEDYIFIGIDLVEEMIKKGNIIGSTFIYVMSQEYGIPVIDVNQKKINDIEYEIISVNNDNILSFIKKYYSSVKNEKELIDEYDNIVFVIKDDPYYSSSNKSYITTTVVIDKKDSKPYIINIKYPMKDEHTFLDYKHKKYNYLEEIERNKQFEEKKKLLIKNICNKDVK